MRHLLIALTLLLTSAACMADKPPIFRAETKAGIGPTYAALKKALEARRFWVVFEADIQRNISGFAKRWGKDYNPQGLTALRSIVVCNGWFANKVTGLDPDMAALCPIRLGVYGKDGKTVVVFARPSLIAKGSPALPAVQEVEDIIIAAIKQGIAKQ